MIRHEQIKARVQFRRRSDLENVQGKLRPGHREENSGTTQICPRYVLIL